MNCFVYVPELLMQRAGLPALVVSEPLQTPRVCATTDDWHLHNELNVSCCLKLLVFSCRRQVDLCNSKQEGSARCILTKKLDLQIPPF